ncbi:MAG TPA: xanthine dehydrogenase family protein molybdopterin-binding subunit [Gemmatimonadales bacterium]|nr:xanthine dehydrogenase family protein molybdopterin-binding subunit [Gemmatimonadales bacterium]
MATATVTRRDFLKAGALASGLVIGVRLPAFAHPAQRAAATPLAPSAFLQITRDGQITVWVARSEMGQGVRTALPMMVAEELEVELAAIRIEQAPSDPKFGEQATGGSSSVSDMWTPLRTAGAQAREMLIGAAARTWGVPAEECRAENGGVVHGASGRRAGYGELVPVAAALKPPENPRLKSPGEFRILGRSVPRVDTPSKVDGSAQFGIDVRLPGMLYACIARCPVFGRRLSGYDEGPARAVAGVRDVVPLEPAEVTLFDAWKFNAEGVVAVVAESSWAAFQGCRALECRWDAGPEDQIDSARLARIFADRVSQPGIIGRNDGDAAVALRRAARTIEAVYDVPFLAHATMEPMNCTADVRAGRCDIYVPSQWPTGVRRIAAQLTGLPEDAVTVHTTLLGGGFGRRFEMQWVMDAVRVSRAVGRPVQVIWTREHDMQHDNYRPMSHHVVRAGLDRRGAITAWMHRMAAPSIIGWHAPAAMRSPGEIAGEALDGAEQLPYAIPNLRVEYCPVKTPVPVGWWRSVYASQNAFVNECFMDELARATKRDPLELRRALLKDQPRHLAVLELAAAKAGWGAPLPDGRTRGIAVHKFFSDTVVAEVAEVSLGKDGVRVHRVVCATDCGLVLHPDIVRAQMESGVVYALSAALSGAITIERGRVKQSNFHDYPVVRMSAMPRVETYIVPSQESPHGVGEPAVPPLAPAVANAVFAATGKPVRRLPITPLA